MRLPKTWKYVVVPLGLAVCLVRESVAQPEAPTAPTPPETPASPEVAPADSPPPPEVVPPADPTPAEQKETSVPTEVAPDEPPAPTVAPTFVEKFSFGSYGRVQSGSNLRGGPKNIVNVVAYGSRIIERDYFELDFRYHETLEKEFEIETAATLGFGQQFFHYSGEFDTQAAVRNLYVEASREFGALKLAAWGGSRMLRGDDMYLLDTWPLDDANTVGGGLKARWQIAAEQAVEAGVHTGWARLADPFYTQDKEVFAPGDGATTIPDLDRQQTLTTAQASFISTADPLPWKAKIYGEFRTLPEGTRTLEDDSQETLPSDQGFAVGAQLGTWGFMDGDSHANLFVRYGRGLSAFDELSVPQGSGADETFSHASELVIGFSGNVEQRGILPWGVLVAALSRRFSDAESSNSSIDGWEYILDARPYVHLHKVLALATDISWQARFPRGLEPSSLQALDPAVLQIAPMLIFSPKGPGSYVRPQIRLMYRFAHLNEGARNYLYPLEDSRRGRASDHFLGIAAEWWFNSSYR